MSNSDIALAHILEHIDVRLACCVFSIRFARMQLGLEGNEAQDAVDGDSGMHTMHR